MTGSQHGNGGAIAIAVVVVVMAFGFFLWMRVKQGINEAEHRYSYQKVLTTITTYDLCPVNEVKASYIISVDGAYIVYAKKNEGVSRVTLPMETTTICRLSSASQARLEKREEYFHRVEHDRHGERRAGTCQPKISYTICIPTNKTD